MAFSLTCPQCSAKMKTATAIPIGRTVQCPKCKESFKVSDDNMEEVADTKLAMPSTAAKPAAPSKPAAPAAKPAAAKSAPVAAVAAKKAAPPPARKDEPEDDEDNPFGGMSDSPKKRRDEEEDETPRSRKRNDDEDDDRPRKRKRDDEEDETPRARKRNDDEDDNSPRKRRREEEEEEDEAPRSRKKKDDDDDKPRRRGRDENDEEDEDSPRSRKRRDADEDDEDKPRRRSRDEDDEEEDRPRRAKKKKKKGNTLLLVGLAAGGLAAVAGVVFLCIWLFGGGGFDKEMMAFLPENTAMVVGIDVEKLMEVDIVKENVDKFLAGPGGNEAMEGLKKAGLTVKDFSKILAGMDDKKGGDKGGVFVVRFKNPIDKAKINKALNANEEQKSGGKSYQRGTGDMPSIYYPKDDLAVFVANEEIMKKVLAKEEGKVTLSEPLKQLVNKVSGGNFWMAASGNTTEMLSMAGPAAMMAGNMAKDAKGVALSLDIDSSKLKARGIVRCADEAAATKIADEANKNIKEAREMASKAKVSGPQAELGLEIINSADVSSSGDLLEGSIKFSYGPFKDLMMQQLKGIGGAPMPMQPMPIQPNPIQPKRKK